VYLRRLETENFRNLRALDLAFDNAPVVICGENGQGKSNLLEALVLGCTGALWRTTRDEEAICWGSGIARVKAEVLKAKETIKTEIALAREEKPLCRINGVARRRSDLLGIIPAVGFSSEDLQIIKGEPSRRRHFLNLELSQISRSYHWNLLHYGRALEQRNRLLKETREGRGGREALFPWEEALARYGAKLVERRAKFLQELEKAAEAHLARLSPAWAPLRLKYEAALGKGEADRVEGRSAQEVESLLRKGLEESREEEIARGFSLAGPHRDEFRLLVGDIDQHTYGSQGEQRGLAIALRLGLAEMVEKAAGERPILIVDDVFSELDERRRRGLLDSLGSEKQVFLTTPLLEEVPKPLLEKGRIYRLHAGEITPVREGAA